MIDKIKAAFSNFFTQATESKTQAVHLAPAAGVESPPIEFSQACVESVDESLALEGLLKNLTSEQELKLKASWNEEIEKNPKKARQLADAMAKTLPKGKYYHDLIGVDEDKLVFHALSALKNGWITVEQFATLRFYADTKKAHPKVTCIPLFIEKKGQLEVNPEARKCIKQSLLKPRRLFMQHDLRLDDEQLERFFEEMKERPLSERQFMIYEDDNLIPFEEEGIYSKLTVAYHVRSLGIPLMKMSYEGNMRMTPSFSMMQAYLKAKHGDEAWTLEPSVGAFLPEELVKNARDRKRPVGISLSPIVELPDEADGSLCDGADFSLHDFYHALAASAIPKKAANALIEIGSQFFEHANELAEEYMRNKDQEVFKSSEMFIKAAGQNMLDMEFPTQISNDEEKVKDAVSRTIRGLVEEPPEGVDEFVISSVANFLRGKAREICTELGMSMPY